MQFHTGLIALDYFRFPKFPYRGNGWSIQLAPAHDKMNFGVWSEILAGKWSRKKYLGREVVITAASEERAQRAADLIHSAMLALELERRDLPTTVRPGEHPPLYFPNQDRDAYRRRSTNGIPLACLLAARASKKLRLVYALSKLRISLDTSSVPNDYLDPERHSDNLPKSPFPEDHVRYAFAIVAAWSCIEELGFDIRASSTNPSKINGAWNPRVKADLEARLRSGHINLRERCLWNLRGPRTRIEMKRPPEIVSEAEWVRHLVRDGEIEVIDAIGYVSFLRSTLAAHRLNHATVKLLSVYDVANAQFVARRLLLETMGLWRYQRRGTFPG